MAGRRQANRRPSNSPTITLGATQAGIVLGTAGYMSPEQAKGRAADRRSDVWSFGCMLFEMLAGSRAFEGEDITDTIAAIVRGEPNWQALPASTPPSLRQLIERTLIKDRTQRLPDMSVVRYILNEPGFLGSAGSATLASPAASLTAAGVPGGYAAPARTTLKALIFWLVILAAAVGIYQYSSAKLRTAGVAASHLTIVLPEGLEVVHTNMAPLAISPDGRSVAFPGRKAGRTQLYVYDISTGETRALDGTDDARSPFFKPDGRWIGFFGRRKLRKITIGGTSPDELADAEDGRGATWSTDDIIYYAPNNATGLWSVPASGGGAASQLTKPDPAASEISHRNPYALPGGKALLFMVWTARARMNTASSTCRLPTAPARLWRGRPTDRWTSWAGASSTRAGRTHWYRCRGMHPGRPSKARSQWRCHFWPNWTTKARQRLRCRITERSSG
jgi:hypothetical protein